MIDKIGQNCDIDKSISIWSRGDYSKKARIIFGNNVNILPNVRLVTTDTEDSPNSKLVIGDNVYINYGSFLSGEGGLEIGNKCLIGPNVNILSAGHQFNLSQSIYDSPLIYKNVFIDDEVWIGANVTILPGVKIFKGAIVGAGSVVTKNLPAYSVSYGNPARVKSFQIHSKLSFLHKIYYRYLQHFFCSNKSK